jgi:hypothetical protein
VGGFSFVVPPGWAEADASQLPYGSELLRKAVEPGAPPATLSWNLRTKSVSVRVQMAGFTPGSSHAMHIRQGSCTAAGAVLVPFPDVTADEHGVIDTTVTASQPSPASLAAGTVLNIHLGSGAELGDPGSLGDTPISCADIAPGASTTVTMAPLPQPGQRPQGSAT